MQLSWKVILAPLFGALFGWLTAHGIDLSPAQQANATQLFLVGGATLATWAGHYWHEKTQIDDTLVPPASKQSGWVSLRLLFPLLLLLALLASVALSGCQALGIPQPLTFDEQLASAYTAHTAVVNAATQAVTAGTLSSGNGQQVLTMAQSSRALLDAARAAETAGNAAGASSELTLATSALTALQTFLNNQVKPQ